MAGIIQNSGVKAAAHLRIVDRTDNRLVYEESAPTWGIFHNYHHWRCLWCQAHRKAWAPRGFREGKINPLNLLFYYYHLIWR